LFDFDGTICRRNSYQALLRGLLAERTRFSISLLWALAARRLRLVDSLQLKNLVVSRFRNWSWSEVQAYGTDVYHHSLRPHLFPDALKELDRTRREGHHILVISGAFDFLLRPFCAEYGLDVFAATWVAFDGDRCLGRLAGEEMLGSRKVDFLRQHFAGNTVAWEESCAYSDEPADLPMLNLVGHPVIVNARQHAFPGMPSTTRFARWK
jgi:putative phosphoserine phosphatase/1-acylglycerol-3-phosphate O-acyltransferase